MTNLHTLIISPKYRPSQDGLSDYVFFFLKELRNQNIKINLVTSSDVKIREFARGDHDVFPIIKSWDFLGPMKIIKFVMEKNPQNILIEYVPHMYGRAGLNFYFPYYVFVLKFILRKKIILMAHELHYPFEYNIKTGILYCWHMWNLFLLSISSNKILTTTENFVKILKRFSYSSKKINLLPVGPNIGRERGLPAKNDVKNLILFGSLHPSRNTDVILATLTDYFKNNLHHPFILHIIGADKDEVLNHISNINYNDRHYLLDKTIFHGKLTEQKVAALFVQCHFSINYFVDGVSCRRGSAISALNLGLPIITNYTERSDSIFLDQPIIFITPIDKLHQCLKRLSTLDPNEYEKLRMKSYDFIDEHFSWKKICKLYLDYTDD